MVRADHNPWMFVNFKRFNEFEAFSSRVSVSVFTRQVVLFSQIKSWRKLKRLEKIAVAGDGALSLHHDPPSLFQSDRNILPITIEHLPLYHFRVVAVIALASRSPLCIWSQLHEAFASLHVLPKSWR